MSLIQMFGIKTALYYILLQIVQLIQPPVL